MGDVSESFSERRGSACYVCRGAPHINFHSRKNQFTYGRGQASTIDSVVDIGHIERLVLLTSVNLIRVISHFMNNQPTT
jgi:hypothetical protein